MSNESLFFITAFFGIGLVFLTSRLGREWLFSSIVLNLILVGTLGGKLIETFGIVSNAGNIFYACVFLATYFLLEKYGKQEAIKTIWFGSIFLAFFVLLSQLAVHYTPVPASNAINQVMTQLFSFSSRIMIGSFLAYIFAQYINISIYEWIKQRTGRKFLWLRANGANIISQLVDSSFFFSIVFFDLPGPLLVQAILAGWVIKLAVVLMATPLLYLDSYLNRKNWL